MVQIDIKLIDVEEKKVIPKTEAITKIVKITMKKKFSNKQKLWFRTKMNDKKKSYSKMYYSCYILFSTIIKQQHTHWMKQRRMERKKNRILESWIWIHEKKIIWMKHKNIKKKFIQRNEQIYYSHVCNIHISVSLLHSMIFYLFLSVFFDDDDENSCWLSTYKHIMTDKEYKYQIIVVVVV